MATAFTCLVAVRLPSARSGAQDGGAARLSAAALREYGRPLGGGDARLPVFGFDTVARALRFAEAARAAGAAAGAALRAGLHGVSSARADAASHGRDVALARRLAETAPRGGILATAAVRDAAPDAPQMRFVDHGRLDMPGQPGPVDIARVEPRTGPATDATTLRIGPFEIDTERFELRRDGARVAVEPRTFDLIALLARHGGRTVTRDTIFRTIWGEQLVSDAALSSQVRAARRALGDDGAAQSLIATVHGRGFRLRAEVTTAPPPELSSDPDPLPAHPADPAPQPAPTEFPTVAVLPCVNLDEDGRGAIVAQGLTEDLINALSKNRWLRVVSRNPAFALGRTMDDRAEIAARLGADYLVTGSVRRAGNRVRTTMQTTDARDMRCIWSETFDREMRDIFALQEEISGLVAARIATELGIAEQKRAARAPRVNLGAWELYALGSADFYRFTPESNRRCQELMRQAIRLDPDFAEPYSRLAYAMILEMVYFEGPIDAARLDEALRLAEAGGARDDQEANAFFTLGRVRLVRREYARSIDALEHAVALNPCHALSFCGLGDSLAYEGRIDAALEQFDRAIALSPHDPFRWAFMSYRALAHLFGGQVEDAAHWARRATLVPNAHYWAHANRTAALGFLDDPEAAQSARRELMRARPGFTRGLAQERLFFVKRRDQTTTFLEGLRRTGVP